MTVGLHEGVSTTVEQDAALLYGSCIAGQDRIAQLYTSELGMLSGGYLASK